MKNKFLIALITLAIVGGFVYFYSAGRNSDAKPSFYVNPADGSVPRVVDFVKNKLLKQPDSYQSVRWFRVEKNRGGNFEVRHRFRAKNDEGEYNDPATLLFVLTPEGEVIQCR